MVGVHICIKSRSEQTQREGTCTIYGIRIPQKWEAGLRRTGEQPICQHSTEHTGLLWPHPVVSTPRLLRFKGAEPNKEHKVIFLTHELSGDQRNPV